MKVALCYSGQAGSFHKAYPWQKQSFITNDMNVYIYTSDLVSQKTNPSPNLPPSSRVYEYLPGGKGWRENLGTYGVIYRTEKENINKVLLPLREKAVKIEIESEDLLNSTQDWDMSKWEWLKKRQLNKLHKCNQMIEEEYDIVVRTRFEFGPRIKIPIEQIFNSTENNQNKIFLFGGWDCVPPMVFMDKFMCDGFAFGSQKAMNIFCSLGLQEKPYLYDPKYKDCWDKFGDNVEYQFQKHLEANGIEVVLIGKERSMYHLWR
jgi:hypothetical protein